MRIEKIKVEIGRAKEKIAEWQARLHAAKEPPQSNNNINNIKEESKIENPNARIFKLVKNNFCKKVRFTPKKCVLHQKPYIQRLSCYDNVV